MIKSLFNLFAGVPHSSLLSGVSTNKVGFSSYFIFALYSNNPSTGLVQDICFKDRGVVLGMGTTMNCTAWPLSYYLSVSRDIRLGGMSVAGLRSIGLWRTSR